MGSFKVILVLNDLKEVTSDLHMTKVFLLDGKRVHLSTIIPLPV